MTDHLDELNAVRAQLENAREEIARLMAAHAERKQQTAKDWETVRAEVDSLHEANFRLTQRLLVKRAEATLMKLGDRNCYMSPKSLGSTRSRDAIYKRRRDRVDDRYERVQRIRDEARAALETQ
jgi:chromosome segregation ATPase